MSNIFVYLVRDTGGVLPLSVGSGPLVDPVRSQGLNLTELGEVYASFDAVTHHAYGLPFDTNGRLVVSLDPVSYRDQGIPFTVDGFVAAGGEAEGGYYDQGLLVGAGGLVASGVNPYGDAFVMEVQTTVHKFSRRRVYIH